MSGVVIDVGVDTSKSNKDLQSINANLRQIADTATSSGKSIKSAFTGGAAVQSLNKSINQSTKYFKEFDAVAPAALDRTAKSAVSASSGMSSLAKAAGVATSAFASMAVAIAGMAKMDVLTNLQNKLKLVTQSATELVQTQQELVKISNAARSEFKGSVDTYFALARSMRKAGSTQEELLGVTSTIQKAIAVSGTTADSAAAALFQLSQGMASGTLRGEELNSVMEQIPRLGQALTDSLGMNAGQLRKFAEAGELTSEVVFKAIQTTASQIDTEFSKVTATFQQGIIAITDGFMYMVGSINQALQITAGFYKIAKSVADGMFSFGNNVGGALSLASQQIDNYITEFTKFTSLEVITNRLLSGELHFFDISALNAELSAVKTMYGYFTKIADLDIFGRMASVVSSATNAISMSLFDLYRLVSGTIYALASLFHTFVYMIPDIRGPVQEVTSVITNAFIKMGVGLDAALAGMLRPIQRFTDGLSESLTGFLFWDTRVQRAWVGLAKSKGLDEFIGKIYELSAALQTRNFSNFWIVLYDKINFVRTIKEDMREVLIYFNLIDNRFLFVNNIRFDRLIFAVKTIGLVVQSLYTDILYPKFAPAVAVLYTRIKSFTDALMDTITDRIESFDAAEFGKSLAESIKGGLAYLADSFDMLDLNINIFNKDAIVGAMKNVAEFFKAIAKGVVKFASGFSKEIGLNSLFSSLANDITSFFRNLNPSEIGQALFSSVSKTMSYARNLIDNLSINIDFGKVFNFNALQDTISDGLGALSSIFSKLLSNVFDSGKISEIISSLLDAMSNAVEKINFFKIGKTFGTIMRKMIEDVISFASVEFKKFGDYIVSSGSSGVVGKAGNLVKSTFKGVGEFLNGAMSGIGFDKVFNTTIESIVSISKTLYARAIGPIKAFGDAVIKIFYNVWDVVVGHSYWPDTVNGIISWAKKLVNAQTPVQEFASKVINTFKNMYESISSGKAAEGLKNSFSGIFKYLEENWYSAAVSIGSTFITILGTRLIGGSDFFTAIVTEQIFSGFLILTEKFSENLAKLSKYIMDVIGNIITKYIKSIIEGIDALITIIPKVVQSGLKEFGTIGKGIASVLSFLPNELVVIIVGGLLAALKDAAKDLPGYLASTIGEPLMAGMKQLMTKVIPKGNFIYQMFLGTTHPAAIAAGILGIVTAIFDQVTLAGSLLVGTPLIYMLLLGDSSTSKFISDISTKIVAPVLKGISTAMGSMAAKFIPTKPAWLTTWMQGLRLELATTMGKVGPQLPPSVFARSANNLFENLKKVYGNILRNWDSYVKGQRGFFSLLFTNEQGKSDMRGLITSFETFSTLLKAKVSDLWASIKNSQSGIHFDNALQAFKEFGIGVWVMLIQMKNGLRDFAWSAVDTFSKLFPKLTAIVSDAFTKIIGYLNSTSKLSKTTVMGIGVALAGIGMLFSANASAATQFESATTSLAGSIIGLVASVMALNAALKLIGAISNMREAMKAGMGGIEAFKKYIGQYFIDIAMMPKRFYDSIVKWFGEIGKVLNGQLLKNIFNGVISAFTGLWAAVKNISAGIVSSFKHIIDSGVLTSLTKMLNELFWGVVKGIGNLPKLFSSITSGTVGALPKVLSLVRAFFSLKAVLIGIGVAATAALAAGFFGDDDFLTNIERTTDALGYMFGLLERPPGAAIFNNFAKMFKNNGAFGGIESNIVPALEKVDFSKMSENAIMEFSAISQATATTLNNMQNLYKKNGKLTEEQATKVREAIEKEQQAIAALPQKVATFDLNKVNENLVKALQPNDSWFVGFKNIAKYIYNNMEEGDITKVGVDAGVSVVQGIASGIRSAVGAVSGAWDYVAGKISDGFGFIGEKASAVGNWLATPFKYAANEIGGFFEGVAAGWNSMMVNISNIMFPDTGSKYLEQLQKDMDEINNYKIHIDTSEFNQLAKFRQEFADAYQARYDGLAKTKTQEKLLDDQMKQSWENLTRYTEEVKRLGKEREDAVQSYSAFEKFKRETIESMVKAGEGNRFDSGIVSAVQDMVGFKDYAKKKLLDTESLFDPAEMAIMGSYSAQFKQLRQDIVNVQMTSEKGIDIRVRAKQLEQTQAEIAKLFNDFKFMDKGIDIAITASGLEFTKKQFYEFYRDNTEAAKEWLKLGEQLQYQMIRLANLPTEGADAARQQILEQIDIIKKAMEKGFEANIKPTIKQDYFAEFNKQLQDAGVSQVETDLFLNIANNSEVKGEIDALFTSMKANKKEMQDAKGFDAWLQKFQEMHGLAAQLKGIMISIAGTLETTASTFGARISQIGALGDSQREKLDLLAARKTALESALKTPGISTQEQRSLSKPLLEVEAEIKKASKQFEEKSADTGKGMAKSLTDAFSTYIKDSGFKDIDIIDYAKMSKEAKAAVDKLIGESTEINKRLKKTKVGDKPTEQQAADLIKITQLNKQANKIMEDSNRTIEDMVSTFGQVYEGFTIASWFELPASTLADITDLYTELKAIQDLMKEKPTEELNQQLATRFKAYQDRKFELGTKNANYGARKESSGLGVNYDKISTEAAQALDKLNAEMKVLMNKQATAVGDDGRKYYQQIKEKQKEIDTQVAAALEDMPVDQTRAALQQVGISVGEEMYKATDAQLAKIREFQTIIKQESERMRDAPDESTRLAAEAIVRSTREELQIYMAKIARDPMKEAGKGFASSVSSSFTTGLQDVLKSDKSVKEATEEFVDKFTSQVLDTFTQGLMEPFTGEGGMVDKLLKQLGSGIFGLGSGATGSSPEVTLLTSIDATLKAMQANMGLSPLSGNNSNGGIFDKVKSFFGFGDSQETPGVSQVTKVPDIKVDTQVLEDLPNTLNDSLSGVAETVDNFGSGIASTFSSIDFSGLLGSIGSGIGDLFSGMGDMLMKGFEMIMSLFSKGGYVQAFANGGPIKAFAGGGLNGKIRGPGTGTSDSILARVSNGEYIVNALSTSMFRPVLDAINFGRTLPQFASGGSVDYGNIAMAQAVNDRSISGQTAGNTTVVNMNITGDISRQTRAEVLRMLPQINAGVKQITYENGGR